MMKTKRQLQLFVVLLYDSDSYITSGHKFLTEGQRICINQERAYLMRDEIEENDFHQAESINEKINFILQQIKINNLTSAYSSHARSLLII